MKHLVLFLLGQLVPCFMYHYGFKGEQRRANRFSEIFANDAMG